MKRCIKWLTAVLVILFSLTPVIAEEKMGDITIKYPVDNVTFKLFYLGEWKAEKINYQGAFKDAKITDDLNEAADALSAFVKKNNVNPSASEKSKDGEVNFSNIKKGIYLVSGEEKIDNKVHYRVRPMLLSMPAYNANTESWSTIVNAKYEQETIPGNTSLEVLKVWKDNNSKNRPKSIEVELLRNNEVYDTKTLSKKNNWKHTWNNLDGDYEWTVYEKTTFNDYSVSISRSNRKVVITNKLNKETPPKTPKKQRIPQTGQLWWPVVILAGIGVVLISIGLSKGKADR